MVDVGEKQVTSRVAVAIGELSMHPTTLEKILNGDMPKGDVLGTARIAGIMAAKKTSDIIPLCHPLPINGVDIDITPLGKNILKIEASVKVTGKTGVEMEALTAVSATALTLYDMAKAVDKDMVISNICLLEKSGGKSGYYKRK